MGHVVGCEKPSRVGSPEGAYAGGSCKPCPDIGRNSAAMVRTAMASEDGMGWRCLAQLSAHGSPAGVNIVWVQALRGSSLIFTTDRGHLRHSWCGLQQNRALAAEPRQRW